MLTLGPFRMPKVTTHMMQHMHMPLIRYGKSAIRSRNTLKNKETNRLPPVPRIERLRQRHHGQWHGTPHPTALSRASLNFLSGLEPTPLVEPQEGKGLPNRSVVMQHVKQRPRTWLCYSLHELACHAS